jgi:hypothetical protein
MDRHNFRAYVRAVAVDRVSFGIWLLLILFYTATAVRSWLYAGLGLASLPVVVWGFSAAVAGVFYADALAALISERPKAALALLNRLLWGPRRLYPLAEPALLLRAQTLLRLEDVASAERDLSEIAGRRVLLLARFVRGQIALGKGDPGPLSEAVMDGSASPTMAITVHTAQGLLLAHGYGDITLDDWRTSDIVDAMPGYVAELWQLLEAATRLREGDEAARRLLPEDLGPYRYFGTVYPDVWRWISP